MALISHLTAPQIGEEALWIERSKKDPSQFEPLYNRYFEAVFRFIYQRMDSKDVTADITSQVFLKALLNIHKYYDRGLPFYAWLYRIAISEIGNFYSSSKKFRVINIETSGLHEMVDNIESEPSEARISLIIESLKTLSHSEMLLIEMRFFEARSFKEIGDILAITENNAKVKVYRILDKIRKTVTRNNF